MHFSTLRRSRNNQKTYNFYSFFLVLKIFVIALREAEVWLFFISSFRYLGNERRVYHARFGMSWRYRSIFLGKFNLWGGYEYDCSSPLFYGFDSLFDFKDHSKEICSKKSRLIPNKPILWGVYDFPNTPQNGVIWN